MLNTACQYYYCIFMGNVIVSITFVLWCELEQVSLCGGMGRCDNGIM
jgi:hypothetical protein